MRGGFPELREKARGVWEDKAEEGALGMRLWLVQ